MLDWFHYLFRTAAALAIGFSVVDLIDWLLKYEDPEIKEDIDRIRKSILSDWKNRFNDSVEVCIDGIRKVYEAEIEKKQDNNLKVCSDTLEECLSNVREVLKSSFEDRLNGTLNEEKLLSDENKCLTDINELIK